ncbi:thioredoxin-like protein [Ochromonadaceae sp. CCMP2298]|nr:thioredoxin-like protein [Ochromonadaceae sp. CCMP2298]
MMLLALCLAALLVRVQCKVAELNDVSLGQQLGEHKTMLVLFYAPWCSHSKAALPVWEEMAQSMASSGEDKDIFVAQIDVVKEPDAYYKHDIQSFPTIKAYVNHNALPIVYDGERVANTMWRYFRLLHRPYVTSIISMDQFAELQETKLTKERPLVLAMLPATDDDSASRSTAPAKP